MQRLITLFAFLTLFTLSNFGYACTCPFESEVEHNYEMSEVVFTGKVVSTSRVPLSKAVNKAVFDSLYQAANPAERDRMEHFDMRKTVLKVKSFHKGKLKASEVVIYSPWASSACGFGFKEGEDYVVYGVGGNEFPAGYFPQENLEANLRQEGSYWTSQCLRNTSDVKSEEKAIDTYQKSQK